MYTQQKTNKDSKDFKATRANTQVNHTVYWRVNNTGVSKSNINCNLYKVTTNNCFPCWFAALFNLLVNKMWKTSIKMFLSHQLVCFVQTNLENSVFCVNKPFAVIENKENSLSQNNECLPFIPDDFNYKQSTNHQSCWGFIFLTSFNYIKQKNELVNEHACVMHSNTTSLPCAGCGSPYAGR